MPRVQVFDVNETLLDLAALDAHFARLFGDKSARSDWFGLVLRYAMTLSITGRQSDFGAVGAASLAMVADIRNVELAEADIAAVGAAMRELPAHPDVTPALDLLAEAGLSIVALTNSPLAAANDQLANAGIADRFEHILSVEQTGRFKPSSAVYQHAAVSLGLRTTDLRMVAAHDWDIAGAMAAGMAGAYVTRSGMVRNPLFPEPDIVGPDMIDVANQIVRAEGR